MSHEYVLKPFAPEIRLNIDYARELNEQQLAAVTGFIMATLLFFVWKYFSVLLGAFLAGDHCSVSTNRNENPVTISNGIQVITGDGCF